MPPLHLSSTSRALYRVFVAPNLPTARATPLRTRNVSLLPQTTVRSLVYKKKNVQRQALRDYYIFDAAIEATHINLVDQDGRFHSSVPINEALRSYNRVTHHLLQMSPGRVDDFGVPDPEHLPTCKIISKMDLRAQFNKKLDIERRKKKGQGAGPAPKNLELNWAIAGGDLKHRLEKLKGFLREGRKVEVLLGPKRKGRKATGEEMKGVLEAVREAMRECKGAGEVKQEGVLGGVMTLVFEGRKMEEKREEKAEERKEEV